jgi:hypothetical protein
MTIEEALEWMREQNRQYPDPCPEDSFEEVLQTFALKLLQDGLVEDIEIVEEKP